MLNCHAVLRSCGLAVMQSESFVTLVHNNLNRAKMGTIKNFEELEVWKMSRELVNLIYSDFRNCRDFSFKDQISRAGLSVMNNISEGFCRNSDSEFRQFLNISKGSAGEVKSMYYIAEDQKHVSPETAIDRRTRVQKLINGNSSFMKYLQKSK
jgi:four helix bundle protein